ncbi:MAG: MarR family transcriptional regulator [Clostridiales bacterium]|nr:MarR family transcriptional regulator [Clostridiales bacterium]
MNGYDALKLENQLCFPLYAAAKEVVKKYKPYLDAIELTYTQYLVMMALWENSPLSVKALGERLYLDSGTLTPLLKKLEKTNRITRTRSENDERNVIVSLTKRGARLREQAVGIPEKIRGCINLSAEDARMLYALLHKILKADGGIR